MLFSINTLLLLDQPACVLGEPGLSVSKSSPHHLIIVNLSIDHLFAPMNRPVKLHKQRPFSVPQISEGAGGASDALSESLNVEYLFLHSYSAYSG